MNKILVIEDEKSLLEEVLDVLHFEGYEAIGANNGLSGLQQAREYMPDLIVCDVMMPELDGYEVLRDLRNDSNTMLIPFIFLTAKSETSDRRRGMNLGADDYVAKPFTNTDLLAVIRTRLSKQAAAETQQLQVFSQKLVMLIESERQHAARRLRDELGQLIAGLQLTLEMGMQLPSDMLQKTLQDALNLTINTGAMVNNIAQDLWPAVLDHLGLLPALFWQFERYTDRTGILVDFNHDGLQRLFTSEIKVGMYHVIQEALQNIAEHADISRATVQVWIEDDTLHARVLDEGMGFNLNEAFKHKTPIGLTTMRERLISLGGELGIVTAPEQGTQVLIKIPLDSNSEKSKVESVYPTHEIAMRAIDMIPEEICEDDEQVFRQLPNRSGEPTTVLLADANEIMRRGLKSSLEIEPDISVVAEVDHGKDVISMVKRLKPDMVVLDLTLPEIGGLDITRQIAQNYADTQVLILSSFPEEVYFLESFRAGAAGYILKSADTNELVRAVHEVSAGRRYLSPALSEQALESYLDVQQLQKTANIGTYETLTNRENEIFHLVLESYTNAEIAEQLVISPRTAETHRANMMRKLGVRNHRELLRYALRRGIISIDD